MKDQRPMLPPGSAPDLATLSGADHGHHGDSPFAIFVRLHRLLRGRYHYAIGFGMLGAVAGAVGGYLATRPKYETVGLIHVQPTIMPTLYTTPENQMLSNINSYVQTVANYIQDSRVVGAAARSDEWRAIGRAADVDDIEQFKDALQVVTSPHDSEWIRIKFVDRDPKAAKVAVEQVIEKFKSIHGKDVELVDPNKKSELESKQAAVQEEIKTLRRKIGDIGSEFGATDLTDLHKASMERLTELDKGVAQLDQALAQARAQATAEAAAGKDGEEDKKVLDYDLEASVSAIDRLDDQMHILVEHRNNVRTSVAAMRLRLKPGHLGLQRAETELHAAEESVEDYARKWIDRNGLPTATTSSSFAAPIPRSPEAMVAMARNLDDLRTRRDEVKASTFRLNNKKLEIEELADEIKNKETFLAEIEKRLRELSTESTASSNGVGRVRIVNTGDEAYRPTYDSRKKLAAAGLLVGGGIPFGVVLLLGLMDRRFRYSDEAAEGRIRPTLLGILPYLPEKMRDPEQAGIAAHCVHQIRTLLQIGGADHDRRVFAITSPTSGDGKTSLSLSLGLSFAQSGSETCLIDFDMIGGGLTSAMQAKTDHGLMDAINRGELNGHIRPTGFPRLSIVPIGRDDAQDVSRLSPELVRRVIAEAREKFDIVLIDTGPILGSIEASLVTAAADGVILTLGRGQARPQAERAMEHLSSVGATLMGVVFNRAQPGDFRKAVTSASVRSVPNQGGFAPGDLRALPALGPMASTIAGSFRDKDGEGRGSHDGH